MEGITTKCDNCKHADIKRENNKKITYIYCKALKSEVKILTFSKLQYCRWHERSEKYG